MIKEKKGDLIKEAKDYDVIVHGCNCFCEMRNGIAKTVVEYFPEARQVDLATVKGDKKKLGTITHTINSTPVVVNAYTQYEFGLDKVYCDYEAVKNCMKAVKEKFAGKKIGLPQIGAGRAGGDWNIIRQIIFDELNTEDVTIVYFE
jgi:O-acetyl-ADP-ribose deacetylase (regulator of RNase III)